MTRIDKAIWGVISISAIVGWVVIQGIIELVKYLMSHLAWV